MGKCVVLGSSVFTWEPEGLLLSVELDNASRTFTVLALKQEPS